MKKYKYILFDLDGTLIHSHEGIYYCMRHALKAMNEPLEPTDEFLRQTIGPPLEDTFIRIFGMGEERGLQATRKYREEYARRGVFMNTPIDGAEAMLKTLFARGYVLALATSKPQGFAELIVERVGFSKYLTKIVGCGLDGSLHTKQEVVAKVIKELGATAEECLMVGDRLYDDEGAKANGVDCALIAVGYAEEGEFERCKPTYALNTLEDLCNML